MQVAFNAAVMRELLKTDYFLAYSVSDMVNKRGIPELKALEICFNTYVADDTTVEDEYMAAARRLPADAK